MADKPIIFSGPMVRALLEGRKTQTRRVLPADPAWPMDESRFETERALRMPLTSVWFRTGPEYPSGSYRVAVRYAPGDRLYVREAHALVPSSAYRFSPGVPYAVNDEDGSQACVYREGWERSKPGTGWRPSIHMPRWASRITLTVTEVRVQRLQEISEADAMAEGASPVMTNEGVSPTGMPFSEWSWRDGFHTLWNSLHGPDAWDANPWVVAVSFTVEKRNIDA